MVTARRRKITWDENEGNDDMMFVLKSVGVTVAIVMLMQLEFGGRTLESRAETWLATSAVTAQLRQVASGAIRVSTDLFAKGRRWAGMDAAPSLKNKPWSVEFRHRRSSTTNRAERDSESSED